MGGLHTCVHHGNRDAASTRGQVPGGGRLHARRPVLLCPARVIGRDIKCAGTKVWLGVFHNSEALQVCHHTRHLAARHFQHHHAQLFHLCADAPLHTAYIRGNHGVTGALGKLYKHLIGHCAIAGRAADGAACVAHWHRSGKWCAGDRRRDGWSACQRRGCG